MSSRAISSTAAERNEALPVDVTATVTVTKERLRKIAALENRVRNRFDRMCRGARVFAVNYAAARKDLVALATLRPWEARGLPSWHEYAAAAFGVGERQLRREFAAARVEALLTDNSDTEGPFRTQGPISTLAERILRPLTADDFDDAERLTIWGAATQDGQPPTSATVERAAQDYRRQRAFSLLTPAQQKMAVQIEEQQQQREAKQARARQQSGQADKAANYFREALRAYDRAIGLVRRGGKKLVVIEAGSRRIMDHVRAAITGTEELIAALRAEAQEVD